MINNPVLVIIDVLIKKCVFTVHRTMFFMSSVGVLISPWFLLVYPVVGTLWAFLENRCLFCHAEYALFGETVLGKGNCCVVPSKNRRMLFAGFVVGGIYYCSRVLL